MNPTYSFIPFLKTKPYYEKNYPNRDRIKLKIKTITHIHISSGFYENDNQVIYKGFYKVKDIPTIPGTSLKGCIRSIAEMVSYSCINVIDKEHIDFLPEGKNVNNHNCIICDIFGSKGKKSKVMFSDFKLIKGQAEIINIASSYSPNTKSEYYYENGKFKGYKVYTHGKVNCYNKGDIAIEAITPNSEFEGTIDYYNLSDLELKLLCFSLGLSGIKLKIGYGKNHYLGSIEILCDNDYFIKKAIDYEKINDNKIQDNIKILKEILKIN
ncbi:RAMP superfamily CRISPR-associated protein [Caldicellulosiruptoraceae bacterium PP1]